MIEIRTYDGDADDLANFTQRVWRSDYEGNMLVPYWNAKYFEWQILSDPLENRDYWVAAYDKTKLVGCLLAEPCRLRIGNDRIPATTGSWFTVDPEYRPQMVGLQLLSEQRRRHRERGAMGMLGYVYYGAETSMGPDFWLKMPDTVILGNVGFWIRIIDYDAMSKAVLTKRDAFVARALKMVQRPPSNESRVNGIRPYNTKDLEHCLAITNKINDNIDMAYWWSQSRLSHQLSYKDIPKTFVSEDAGGINGIINYYRLDLIGKLPFKTGIIDLLATTDLAPQVSRDLISAALGELKNADVTVAMLLRLPCYSKKLMLRCGFVPMPSDSYVVCTCMDSTFDLKKIKRFQIPWR